MAMLPEIPISQVVKGAVDQLARSFSDLGTTIAAALDDSGAQAASDIATPLTAVDTTLGLIRSVLAGVVKVQVSIPVQEAEIYQSFSGNFTTTGSVAVFTPSTTFKLKGYSIAAVVGTTLNASGGTGVTLAIYAGSSVAAPVGAFSETAAAGTSIGNNGPVTVNLGSGRASSEALTIKTDKTISTGYISVAGVIWGSYSSGFGGA